MPNFEEVIRGLGHDKDEILRKYEEMIALFSTMVFCQAEKTDSTFRRHFMSSSLFSLLNLAPDPADFYQMGYGYFLSTKDVILIEAITWKYSEPLGMYSSGDDFFEAVERGAPKYKFEQGLNFGIRF